MRLLFNPALAGWFKLALVAALAVTTWQTLTPSPVPIPVDQGDKLAHLGIFFVLAFLSDAAWPERPLGWRALTLLAAYGAAIEIIQGFTPNRDPSWLDLLADLGGLLLYAGAVAPWLRPSRVR